MITPDRDSGTHNPGTSGSRPTTSPPAGIAKREPLPIPETTVREGALMLARSGGRLAAAEGRRREPRCLLVAGPNIAP
jgi:hypothetical protein